jgi:hypothetical protein
LKPEHLPKDFYRGEVVVGGKRHLLFVTDDQIKDFQKMRRWYVDGTFHVAQLPFSQLYSIQGFITRHSKALDLQKGVTTFRENRPANLKRTKRVNHNENLSVKVMP